MAAGAPSGLYAPIIVPAVAVPAAVPTISPGDIQAAAIDAEVQARDLAQAEADKARELAELANENINEKIVTDSTVVQEKSAEALWSAEDKKWQALDALKTAEAQIDGAVASNANILAKSAISGVLPYVAAVGPITPFAAPIPPLVYTPYSAYQTVATQNLIHGQEIKSEIKEESKEENKEAAVKTAEPEKEVVAEQPAELEKSAETAQNDEQIQATESAATKAAENLDAKPALIGQPLFASPIGLYRYNVAIPTLGQLHQPILNYATSVQQVHGVLTPTFVKTAW